MTLTDQIALQGKAVPAVCQGSAGLMMPSQHVKSGCLEMLAAEDLEA